MTIPFARVSAVHPDRRRAAATKRLADAYTAVFLRSPTHEDQQLVLADLAHETGFYRVTGPGAGADARAFADGRRSAFGRIFRFLRMSPEEAEALEQAARAEALAEARFADPYEDIP